jgi:hypothetical protein
VDIAALLLACSVHPDDALLSSIAYVHGRGAPYAVIDVSLQPAEQDDDGLVRTPSSSAARALVDRILSTGGEPVLGLLPARPEWATEFGKAVDDLLDPCGAVEVASAKLSAFDYVCRTRGSQRGQRRGCTLELYGRSLGLPGLRQAVLADVSLSNPFPSGEEAFTLVSVHDTQPSSSGLFFSTPPPPPATSISVGEVRP